MWRTVLALGAAGAAFFLAPADLIDAVSGELVNFFGFVIAAVIPAMALTSTALRGTGMSVRRINQLHDALTAQMRFWAGLVLYGFLAVLLVVIAKPIVACESGACSPRVWYEFKDVIFERTWTIDSRLLNGLIGYVFAIVFGQLTNVLVGLRALLEVNAEAARGEAQQRFDDALSPTREAIAQLGNPAGYGSRVELPEQKVE